MEESVQKCNIRHLELWEWSRGLWDWCCWILGWMNGRNLFQTGVLCKYVCLSLSVLMSLCVSGYLYLSVCSGVDISISVWLSIFQDIFCLLACLSVCPIFGQNGCRRLCRNGLLTYLLSSIELLLLFRCGYFINII